MVSKLATTCSNVAYDILTIFISIADVTTDIWVLIQFYNKDRMTFFGISLTILILAQCSYSMAFAARFNTIDRWEAWQAILGFCCCLPFGTFVAFIMYFGSEQSKLGVMHECLRYDLDLDATSWFNSKDTDSSMVKWIKTKLDRHLGFILEAAIEAFPQSLLQIVAIVYYHEANYVSIISILLSMFSVMSKSLILSQGVEKYTFFWTWLCVVTDFFAIFFTLTWVVYSNDSIYGDFLGNFNIFCEIWLWKVAISILLPVGLALGVYVFVLYLFVYFVILFDPVSTQSIQERMGWSSLWITFSPIVAALCVFGACLACEVFCLSIIAAVVYARSTSRIGDYETDRVTKIVSLILNFIGNGRDKRLRIISINKGLNAIDSNANKTFCDYVETILKDKGYEGLNRLTYNNMRKHCVDTKEAAFFPAIYKQIKDEYNKYYKDVSNGDCIDRFIHLLQYLSFTALIFIFAPILLLSKILQFGFPWIIIGYLVYNDLLFSKHIDLFQMVMLMIYIGLQLIVVLLGIKVFTIHWYLWHIDVGNKYIYWGNIGIDRLEKEINKYYDDVCWYPEVEKIVLNVLGNDIGPIVMDYCISIQLHDKDALLP